MQTKVVIFHPTYQGQPAAGYTVSKHDTNGGPCTDSHITNDAYRCYDGEHPEGGDETLDPCWTDNILGKTVYCTGDPTSTQLTEIDLNGAVETPVPFVPSKSSKSSAPAAAAGPDPDDPTANAEPWAVQLANGVLCGRIAGATYTIEGQRLNYGCADGSSLFGDPDRSKPVWTIFLAPKGQNSSSPEPIKTAWF